VELSLVISSWMHAVVAKISADAVLRVDDSFWLGAMVPAAAAEEIEFRVPLVTPFQALNIVELPILANICGVHEVVPLIYLSLRNLSAIII
jgi:hypothetical protein